MGLLEPQHIILILLVLVLFFGGKKIPELMKGLGKGMKEFKDAQNGESSSTNNNTTTTTTTTPTSTPEEKPKA
ncbi:sec-independent protein translocase protein TatA [Mucilaginibacter frigoritolerans]|uniref:Sec-independent protein translocase protein TatA n=1 Tax=Mucilaginibacter frigoritolerans TaxID=652788 RepID=A0A562U1Y4_9SPHI|nr:twin-arginine translocase TatA/TatE family subunit [Mucilaginibacter frigoritolerans]TWI99851.1 sec-independent protein translocase protein TatA [Mucilaginibacter frigoritolerans]